ncbi:solute carrier family 46 member 2-like isoform X1 [Scyliorhinus torazame]|uniref:solute carrier family 46 member 2-like isoform X1 n=1 Tax=Scyliorhinus torazame TaxID=75743 RepID=UPI003B5B2940
MCRKLFSLIEVVVGLHQIAGAFYDTSLLMLVRDRCSSNSTTSGSKDQQQEAISRFYMIYFLLLRITPLFFTFFLAKLGDQRSRKITIYVPLLGYLVSRSLLLFVILFHWPLEVMFATALVNGLSGGFTAFWAGVMAFASDTSSQEKRSIRLNRVELTYGVAGMIGSMASGHLFIVFKISQDRGAGLMVTSCVFYTLTLVCSFLGLKSSPKQIPSGCHGYGSLIDQGQQESDNGATPEDQADNTTWNQSQRSRIPDNQDNPVTQDNPRGDVSVDKAAIALLYAAGVLYDLGVSGGADVLPIFVLKDPLNWNAVWVGYGNATGYAIFITSFLGVVLFSRKLKDTSLIVMGMVSFSTGMLIMAFVEWTFLYFIARAVMIFALIPMATIRSVISKQIKDTSYGKLFAILQILLTLTGVIASTAFLNIYNSTQDWYPSVCFSLSSAISCLGVIPIMMVARRLSSPATFPGY